jgi:hypothetical protein
MKWQPGPEADQRVDDDANPAFFRNLVQKHRQTLEHVCAHAL